MIWAVLLTIGVQMSALLASRRKCRFLERQVDGLAKENKELHDRVQDRAPRLIFRDVGRIISVMTEGYRVGAPVEIEPRELREAAGPAIEQLNYYIRGLQQSEKELEELRRVARAWVEEFNTSRAPAGAWLNEAHGERSRLEWEAGKAAKREELLRLLGGMKS